MATKKNKSTDAKDIFISYRRKDGATAARLLSDALERRQVSVFFDRESIEAGNFDDALRDNLDAARNVIIVVSQEMFSRGLLADGTYDKSAVENDWVYKEIQISLEAGKNIIPIFVNGVDGFPSNLPAQIAGVSRKDALKLNHEHFDAEMAKLISRLITPRHRLLAAYLEADKEFYNENLENLFRVSQSLSNSVGKDIEAALTKIIRTNWEQTSLSDEQALDALLDGNSPISIKSLCKNLNLDDTGGFRRIKFNILSWLKNNDSREYRKLDSDKDRLKELINACSSVYKSTADRQRMIEQIEEKFEGIVNVNGSKRSSWDVFYEVFITGVDVEYFFEVMDKTLQEQEVKDICDEMLIPSKGRKKELIERIVDYVNYYYEIPE